MVAGAGYWRYWPVMKKGLTVRCPGRRGRRWPWLAGEPAKMVGDSSGEPSSCGESERADGRRLRIGSNQLAMGES